MFSVPVKGFIEEVCLYKITRSGVSGGKFHSISALLTFWAQALLGRRSK